MKRWQEDINIMQRRWREEIESHRHHSQGYVEEGCHCLKGMGIMRKHRTYESCAPNQHCGCCEAERSWHKTQNKKERVQGKLELRYETE